MSWKRRAFLTAGTAALGACRKSPAPPASGGSPHPASPKPWLTTPGGTAPDWSLLEKYQGLITREDFVRLMTGVIAGDDSWNNYITVTPEAALIDRSTPDDGLPRLVLRFAPPGSRLEVPRYWRRADELPAVIDPARPLEGLHIAIDPGHIGGAWAAMEERNFNGGEVKEGEITLRTARVLAPMLDAAGARVSMVRDALRPQTEPDWPALKEAARDSLIQSGEVLSEFTLDREARRLFCRSAEIRARARRVNDTLRPDVVVCLHFNAGGPWDNHLHILAHGCLTKDEMPLDDQRLECLLRLAQGCADTELPLCLAVAQSMASTTGLPAYTYRGTNARPHPASPFVWMRNLLANRLYQCPVVFCEPWVMNNPDLALRTKAGDYEGESMVAGKMRPSIFREYAASVTAGLARYYGEHRNR